jgi:rubredoxin
MSEYVDSKDLNAWECAKCGVPLVIGKTQIAYLGSAYPVDLLKCPSCGLVFIPEELALGKMLDVEKSLEDK